MEFNWQVFYFVQGLYFVGQYAAPVTCLNEMRGWNIAGVTADSMATETYRFYQIVSQLMEQAVPEKAKYCEFVFFDGMLFCISSLVKHISVLIALTWLHYIFCRVVAALH